MSPVSVEVHNPHAHHFEIPYGLEGNIKSYCVRHRHDHDNDWIKASETMALFEEQNQMTDEERGARVRRYDLHFYNDGRYVLSVPNFDERECRSIW